MALMSHVGGEHLLRWVHFLAGVAWIGILYYFNFVQGEWFKEAPASTKSLAIQKLVPRALWWFRWGAMFTFLSGAAILYSRGSMGGWEIYNSSWGILILTGALLGTFMFLNVWLVIWPKQKIVIESANRVAAGGDALECAAAALAKAGLASRTNTLFSIPMLFFMGAAPHLGLAINAEGSDLCTAFYAAAGIILLLELNGLFGKMFTMASVRGVITSGVLLTAILYTVIEYIA